MDRWEFKARHFDATMLFKMGKFYEMFEMDAHVGVEALGLIYMKVVAAMACVLVAPCCLTCNCTPSSVRRSSLLLMALVCAAVELRCLLQPVCDTFFHLCTQDEQHVSHARFTRSKNPMPSNRAMQRGRLPCDHVTNTPAPVTSTHATLMNFTS